MISYLSYVSNAIVFYDIKKKKRKIITKTCSAITA